MLRKILNKFSSVIYVQIWENRIRVVDTKSGKEFDEKPFVLIKENNKGVKVIAAIGNDAEYVTSSKEESINPFSHPRFLLNNFYVAEKILQHAIYTLIGKFALRPAPTVVIHPMEKLEGGLSQIEDRAFRELAVGAGAYEVIIYTGSPLCTKSINLESLKNLDDIVSVASVQ
ncbi:rod shape-determining protein MreB [Thalassotalea nanhaiensis]|uniref:Rod shape-determining protein MreB n=1 Tax=Thalassotalea nanhaiensis TaxID=3065648 RepID=A0ABY9TJE8_9GAMM|nr:rod shape-determining protein MreB [Colwelliaceae bacterium SQ345]